MHIIDDAHRFLLAWGEAIAIVRQLRPRYRARAFSAIAQDIRHTLATMPDKEILPPWLINRVLGWEIFPLPERTWCGLPKEDPAPALESRIIG